MADAPTRRLGAFLRHLDARAASSRRTSTRRLPPRPRRFETWSSPQRESVPRRVSGPHHVRGFIAAEHRRGQDGRSIRRVPLGPAQLPRLAGAPPPRGHARAGMPRHRRSRHALDADQMDHLLGDDEGARDRQLRDQAMFELFYSRLCASPNSLASTSSRRRSWTARSPCSARAARRARSRRPAGAGGDPRLAAGARSASRRGTDGRPPDRGPLFVGPKGAGLSSAPCSGDPARAGAAASTAACIRTPCATPSPRTSSSRSGDLRAAQRCSGTPTSARRRSTRISTSSTSRRSTTAPIRGAAPDRRPLRAGGDDERSDEETGLDHRA